MEAIIAMGLALVLMTVPQMLNSSFTDGTGVDITPEETTIFFNYHIAFVICCMMASYGMTALGSLQMSKLGISVLKEWAVRWILFVLLPVLFFVATFTFSIISAAILRTSPTCLEFDSSTYWRVIRCLSSSLARRFSSSYLPFSSVLASFSVR